MWGGSGLGPVTSPSISALFPPTSLHYTFLSSPHLCSYIWKYPLLSARLKPLLWCNNSNPCWQKEGTFPPETHGNRKIWNISLLKKNKMTSYSKSNERRILLYVKIKNNMNIDNQLQFSHFSCFTSRGRHCLTLRNMTSSDRTGEKVMKLSQGVSGLVSRHMFTPNRHHHHLKFDQKHVGARIYL